MRRDRLGFPAFAQWLVLVAIAAFACVTPTQGDTWWQLRTGATIWRTGRVPVHDTYSWTVVGAPWPNHSWLWQATAAALDRIGGMPLLTLATAVSCVAAVLLVLPRQASRLSVVLLVGALPVVVGVWSVRPQTVSLVLFALVLWLVREQRFAWLPPTFLLWANVHAAVASGGAALLAVTIVALLPLTRTRTRTTRAADRAVRLATATALSALATVLTPLGWGLWTYIPESIGRSKVSGIQEWSTTLEWSLFNAWAWTWIAAVVLVLLKRRSTLGTWPALSMAAIALLYVPLAASAARNMPFLVLALLALLASGPVGGRRWDSSRDPAEGSDRPRPDDDVPGGVPVLVATALVAASAVLACWAVPVQRLGWDPVSPGAVAALKSCDGRLYNTFDAGAYVIGFAPDVPVFVDSRQDPFPREILRFGVLGSAGDARRLVAAHDVRCAFVESGSASAESLTATGWGRTYEDDDWVVLTRSDHVATGD